MSLTNHIESIWIGSSIPIVGQIVNNLPVVGVVDYSMLMSLVATGIGLIGMKCIEIYKSWRNANSGTDHEKLISIVAQIALEKDNHEKIIRVKDFEINKKDEIIKNLEFVISTLTISHPTTQNLTINTNTNPDA